jgi:hypothetical protein
MGRNLKDIHTPTNQAIKLIESSIEVLRNDAGAFAANGEEDKSVEQEQAATLLEAAIILIVKAQDRS